MNDLNIEWIALFYMAIGVVIISWKLRLNAISIRSIIKQLHSAIGIEHKL